MHSKVLQDKTHTNGKFMKHNMQNSNNTEVRRGSDGSDYGECCHLEMCSHVIWYTLTHIPEKHAALSSGYMLSHSVLQLV